MDRFPGFKKITALKRVHMEFLDSLRELYLYSLLISPIIEKGIVEIENSSSQFEERGREVFSQESFQMSPGIPSKRFQERLKNYYGNKLPGATYITKNNQHLIKVLETSDDSVTAFVRHLVSPNFNVSWATLFEFLGWFRNLSIHSDGFIQKNLFQTAVGNYEAWLREYFTVQSINKKTLRVFVERQQSITLIHWAKNLGLNIAKHALGEKNYWYLGAEHW